VLGIKGFGAVLGYQFVKSSYKKDYKWVLRNKCIHAIM